MSLIRAKNVSATGTGILANLPGGTFWYVNVNTGLASAVVKIYNNTSAVAADLVCTIDAATTGTSFFYKAWCPKGIFYALSGANADITIGIE